MKREPFKKFSAIGFYLFASMIKWFKNDNGKPLKLNYCRYTLRRQSPAEAASTTSNNLQHHTKRG
jgi:hypothetical protein